MVENMDKEAEKRVVEKGSDVDRFSDLPESLKLQILLNLDTKNVVKTSLLSSKWRNLWRYVPGLDLWYGDFEYHQQFVSFVDKFLGFNSESCLEKFELKFHAMQKLYWTWNDPDISHVTQWIGSVIKRKVQYLLFFENLWQFDKEVEIPLTVYTCESLVSLKLCDVTLLNPQFVSLPSLKVLYLGSITCANNWPFEMVISGCPILESLTLMTSPGDNIKVLRVCSQSLLSFSFIGHHEVEDLDEQLVVEIDAPRLERLELSYCKPDRFMINNTGSLVKVVIDVRFYISHFDQNDLPKRNMIRNFLLRISNLKDMIITSYTLEAIYNYSRCEPLPLFRNLSSLHVDFKDNKWETLPIFLVSCPSLKSLSLAFENPWDKAISILHGPHSFLPTLEFVEIVKPINDVEGHMKLVSYFLEKSVILKKLTFCLIDFRREDETVILKKLNAIPRLSSSCQVIVI